MNMPRTFITVLLTCVAMIALIAIADVNYEIRTIAETSVLDDEAWVTVQGNITEKIRDDYFLLVDKTGEIELKIRGDEWGQYSYDPTRTAEVYGKIIREDGIIKLEAQKVMYVD